MSEIWLRELCPNPECRKEVWVYLDSSNEAEPAIVALRCWGCGHTWFIEEHADIIVDEIWSVLGDEEADKAADMSADELSETYAKEFAVDTNRFPGDSIDTQVSFTVFFENWPEVIRALKVYANEGNWNVHPTYDTCERIVEWFDDPNLEKEYNLEPWKLAQDLLSNMKKGISDED
jgi:hypothetical protein